MSKRQVKRSNKKLKLERSTEILGQIEQLLVVENSKSNLIILYLRQSIRLCFYVFVINVQRKRPYAPMKKVSMQPMGRNLLIYHVTL